MHDAPTNAPPANQPLKRPLRRRLLRIIVIALATWAFMTMLLMVFQRHLIYFPTRDYEGTPTDVGLTYEDVTIRTTDNVNITGWYVPHDAPLATVLFFHGNAGNISHRLYTFNLLHRLGFAVFMIDYRGYGHSTGKPSETGLYRDADAAWDYLTTTRGQSPDRIVLMGRSLGGAVAIDLATRRTPAALVVESTFTSLLDVGRRHYPLIPVRWILRERFDSAAKIARVRCPILILHGTDDELIPLDLGQALFAAAPEPKQFITTPGGHNEAGFTHTLDFARRMRDFVEQSLP